MVSEELRRLYVGVDLDVLTEAQLAALPEGKDDQDALRALAGLRDEDVPPLIPALLTWLQDVNWPIFHPMTEYLLTFAAESAEPVRSILLGNDDEWKKCILSNLVARWPVEVQSLLVVELKQIASTRDPDGADEEASVIEAESVRQ